MNCIIINGRLGADASLSYTTQQKPVLNFSVGVFKKYKKGTETVEKTIWLTCNLWGDLATKIHLMMKKGVKLSVMGEVDVQEWIDSKTGAKRSKYIINAKMVDIHQDVQPKERNYNSNNNPPHWQDQ